MMTGSYGLNLKSMILAALHLKAAFCRMLYFPLYMHMYIQSQKKTLFPYKSPLESFRVNFHFTCTSCVNYYMNAIKSIIF